MDDDAAASRITPRAFLTRTLASPARDRFITDDRTRLPLDALRSATCFAAPLDRFRGKAVMLATNRQLPTVMSALMLDGVARRLYFCTPDCHDRLSAIVAAAEVDAIVADQPIRLDGAGVSVIACDEPTPYALVPTARDVPTEWVLFTSGTTGLPKMVVHTLASLSGPLDDGVFVANGSVWSTFYDIRRYGGMQIMLRALLGGGSLVLSSADEATGAFLHRAQAAAVSHISGTPSHWRRALMHAEAADFAPRYVRLSGETADQMILDRLRSAFPQAGIAHAYASTEAGVGFDVRDGLAGFPASFIPQPDGHAGIELKVENGTVHIRSARVASGYLGSHELRLHDGFIDTGDIVERHGDRYYFIGRREGVINVGGQKVFPEEVENVLTRHQDVLAARVWSRKNPVTGAVVAAELMLQASAQEAFPAIVEALVFNCRNSLAPYKVPATWRRVDKIEMTAAGKVKRA
jgi:acyl-coenzyme A synthetase/AMP-(fatty) acid ligase